MEYGKKWRLAPRFQYLEDNLVFFASYSGNAPYQTNFLGSPHSSKGQIGTQTGGVLYRPGVPRADGLTSKAASFGCAATNLWVNPSIETNTVGYTALLAAVLTRVAGISEIGAYSLESVTPGAAAGEGWQTPTGMAGMAVVAAQNYTFSLYLQGSGVVIQRISWYTAAGVFISNTDQTVTIQSTFTRSCLSATAPALSAFASISIITNAIQAVTFYADALQFENFRYATPYIDGSLGTGYAWTGAAHASTSTRAAAYIDYNNLTTLDDFVNKGSFSCWLKLDSDPAGNSKYLFRINAAVTGNVLALAYSVGGVAYMRVNWGGGAGLAEPIGVNYNGEYIHVAATYDHSLIKLYINGKFINSSMSVNNWSGAVSAFRVGDSTAGGMNLDGCIDDLAFFDRELTEGEIKEIHHYGLSIGLYESEECNYDPAFVVNAHNKANITHVYIRSNAGVWSNNLMTEPLPFLLQPAVPAIGDCLFVGCEAASATGVPLDSGWFSNVIFNIQGATGGVGSWEYWNGGAFVACVERIDMTYSFTATGKNSMSFNPSANWTPVLLSVAVAGAPASAPTGYWLRINFNPAPTIPALELDYYPHSCTWPYFDVCEDSIEGDYEALLKISAQECDYRQTQSLLFGSRLLDRGSDFDGFFNCSDEQNSDYVTVGLVSASAAFGTNALAATQRVVTYAPGAAAIDEDVFYIRVMSNVFSGAYRLILCANADVDSTANFRIELEPYLVGATSYPIAYTQWKTIPSETNNQYIDLGQITIPDDIGREPTVNGFNLMVHIDKDDLVNATWTFFVIVLIPNDELAAEEFDDNVNLTTFVPACQVLNYLYFDSADDPKYTVKAEAWSTTAKLGNYRCITRGALALAPRQSFRIWRKALYYFNYLYTSYQRHQLHRILLYDAERYIGLRGDR